MFDAVTGVLSRKSSALKVPLDVSKTAMGFGGMLGARVAWNCD